MFPDGGNRFDIEKYRSETGGSNLVHSGPFTGIVGNREKRSEVQNYFIQRQSLSIEEIIEMIATLNGLCQGPLSADVEQLKKHVHYDNFVL